MLLVTLLGLLVLVIGVLGLVAYVVAAFTLHRSQDWSAESGTKPCR